MMNLANHLDSSTKSPKLLPEYYDQWANRVEDYLNDIDKDLCCTIIDGPFFATAIEVVGIVAHNENKTATRLRKEVNDKRCIRELWVALPIVISNYIHGYKTTQEIRNTLKEKFQGNERTNKRDLPTVVYYYDWFNDLIYKCSRSNVVHTVPECNITFIHERSWRRFV